MKKIFIVLTALMVTAAFNAAAIGVNGPGVTPDTVQAVEECLSFETCLVSFESFAVTLETRAFAFDNGIVEGALPLRGA